MKDTSSLFNNIDIALLIFIIVFLFLILRKVLGKKVGYSKKDNIEIHHTIKVDNTLLNKEIDKNIYKEYPLGSLSYKLNEIKKIDSNFDSKKFLESSKKAYKFIVENFYLGNIDTIKDYLSEKVFQVFLQSINNREESEKKIFVEILDFKIADIVNVETKNDTSYIEVKFLTTQSVNKEKPKNIEEIWFFSKKLSNNDSNIWILSKIK